MGTLDEGRYSAPSFNVSFLLPYKGRWFQRLRPPSEPETRTRGLYRKRESERLTWPDKKQLPSTAKMSGGKLEQVLVIKPPHELSFVGPFTQPVSSVMYLSNPSDRKVCFKIKTTAPKRYCVKPNSGVVDPDDSVKISVSLQPFDFDPADKNKHKFMVQSMYAPEGEIYQEQLWKEVDSSQLMDSKLKCVFVVPEAGSGAALAGGQSANNDLASATNGRPWQSATSQQDQPAAAAAAAAANTANSLANPMDSAAAALVSGKPAGSGAAATEKLSQGDMLVGEGDVHMKQQQQQSAEETIRELRENLSALRQDNIKLREEALRQQRLASSRAGSDGSSSGAAGLATSSSSSSSGTDSGGFSVSAMNPDANALSVNYLYVALFILALGIILGKWIF